MMLKKAMLLVGALLLPATAAMAQPGEWRENRRESRQDHRELRDDLRDARRLEGLVARFERARYANNYGELYQLDNELRGLVQNELAESQRELRQDHREVRRDGWERGWDGRRDRRDDIRDARVERNSLERRYQVARQLDYLYGRMDWNALNQKRSLMNELIMLARQEVREDHQEAREDWRERGDDWRDRRDHRRGRDRWR
jgi:hypothetical protein